MSRLFIAVPIDAAVRAEACRVMAELSRAQADVKWVEAENLHLTLAFLGNVDEGLLPKIHDSLAGTASATTPFSMSISGVGAFGAPLRPRVLWLGIGAGAKALSGLSSKLRDALSGNGILFDEADRPFSAHLTLGRVRGPRNSKKLAAALADVKTAELAFAAEKLVLFKSRLSSAGPSYEALFERALGEC